MLVQLSMSPCKRKQGARREKGKLANIVALSSMERNYSFRFSTGDGDTM